MDCPAGLYFSNELKVCEWPQTANCQLDGGGQSRLQRRSNDGNLAEICFHGWVIGYRRDPDNCGCYYQCYPQCNT